MRETVGVLFLIGFVIAYFWVLLGVAVVAVVLWLAFTGWREALAQTRAERVRTAAEYGRLRRAAWQHHAWAMAGDERGTYGRFPPARLDGSVIIGLRPGDRAPASARRRADRRPEGLRTGPTPR